MSRCSCESNTKAACEGGFLLLIFAEHFYCVLLLSILCLCVFTCYCAFYCVFLLRILLRIITAHFYCVFLLSIFTAFSAVYFFAFYYCVFIAYYFLFCVIFFYLFRISGIVPVTHPDVRLLGIAGAYSGTSWSLFRELPGAYSGNCPGLIPGIRLLLNPVYGFIRSFFLL